MSEQNLIAALKRLKVQTGSLACLGCGHEHNCSTKGCAILQEAVAELAKRPPRVHAHWERDEKGNLYCSHCKGYEPFGKTKFCGECGAIMVKEVPEC